jgi:hypothetical protein
MTDPSFCIILNLHTIILKKNVLVLFLNHCSKHLMREYIILYYIILYYMILYYIILYDIISYDNYIISYYMILYHIISYYIILSAGSVYSFRQSKDSDSHKDVILCIDKFKLSRHVSGNNFAHLQEH